MKRGLAILLLFALVFTMACGDDDDDDAAEATNTTGTGGQVTATTGGGTTPTSGGGEGEGDAAAGQELAQAQCLSCHTIDGSALVGPTWQGLYGKEETLEGGETVTVDDAYLMESIKEPNAKVVEGFQPIMPPFASLTDQQIADLIAYIKTLE